MSRSKWTDAQLKALGRVTASFSLLEFIVAGMVWTLGGLDERTGPVFTSGQTIRSLLDLAEGLVATWPDPGYGAALDMFIKRANDVRIRRNHVIHAHWFHGRDADLLIRVNTQRGKGMGKGKITMTSATELSELADAIDLVADVGGSLWSAIARGPAATH